MSKKVFLFALLLSLLCVPDAFARRRGLFGAVSGAASAMRRSNARSTSSTPTIRPRIYGRNRAAGVAAAGAAIGAGAIAANADPAMPGTGGLPFIQTSFGTNGIPPAPAASSTAVVSNSGAQTLDSNASTAPLESEASLAPAISSLPDTGGQPLLWSAFGMIIAIGAFGLRRRLN